jgi:predicted naringenin-chalcone synthase
MVIRITRFMMCCLEGGSAGEECDPILGAPVNNILILETEECSLETLDLFSTHSQLYSTSMVAGCSAR